jgi:ATP-dependent RNA helicase DeaD
MVRSHMVEDTSSTGDAPSTFESLGLGPTTLQAIAELGYDAPTAVQERAIPLLLRGEDLITQAPTGTGKTAAYGLPIVERLQEGELRTQALVIVPTRELAIQVAEALHGLGKSRQTITLPIYGGQPYDRQLRALARGVQVVVGTPGRLIDHLERGTLRLDAVRTVVLDEADEMLDMGFVEDIERLLSALPEARQTALFSATMPSHVQKLARQYMRSPQQLSLAAREAVAPRVRQVYYEVPGHAKPEALTRILDFEQPDSTIVFVRTRRDADDVAERLGSAGYIAQAIHGEINQQQRERVLDRFRQGHTQVLVGTDVAGRGLDIPDVTHVINYDLPADAEAYVHRIGRTGRAGQKGEAVTLVTPRERGRLVQIQRGIHRRLQPLSLPTEADLAVRRRASFQEEILKILDDGELDPFIEMVQDLAVSRDVAELAAAAFKMAAEGHGPRRAAAATPVAQPPAPDQAERPARRARAPRGERMARLFLRVGKRHGVRPADLVGAITGEAGLAGHDIGDIDLYDTSSFVEVPESMVAHVQESLNRSQIRGQAPGASLARPSARPPQQRDGRKFRAKGPDRSRRPRS